MDRILNHADLAVAHIPSRHASRESIVALVRATVDPLQAAEDALFDVASIASIDASAGAQLDAIGRIVGQERGALDDPTYRIWLRARQLVNRSSGTVPELLAIVRAVVPTAATIRAVPGYPAGLTIQVFGVALPTASAVAALVIAAHAGGVRLVFEYSLSVPADTLALDVGPGLDVGHLAGGIN